MQRHFQLKKYMTELSPYLNERYLPWDSTTLLKKIVSSKEAYLWRNVVVVDSNERAFWRHVEHESWHIGRMASEHAHHLDGDTQTDVVLPHATEPERWLQTPALHNAEGKHIFPPNWAENTWPETRGLLVRYHWTSVNKPAHLCSSSGLASWSSLRIVRTGLPSALVVTWEQWPPWNRTRQVLLTNSTPFRRRIWNRSRNCETAEALHLVNEKHQPQSLRNIFWLLGKPIAMKNTRKICRNLKFLVLIEPCTSLTRKGKRNLDTV